MNKRITATAKAFLTIILSHSHVIWLSCWTPVNIKPWYPYRTYFDCPKNGFWEYPWSIPIILLPCIFTVFEKSVAFVTKKVVFKDVVVTGKAKVYAIIIVRDDVACNGVATGTTEEYTTVV